MSSLLAAAQSRPAVIPPRLLSMPSPDCTAGKSCHRSHGTVRLVVEILSDGKVGSVKGEVGNPTLVDAAADAAYQAKFEPGTFLGKPQTMDYVMSLRF